LPGKPGSPGWQWSQVIPNHALNRGNDGNPGLPGW
jgi:hypothetical protein